MPTGAIQTLCGRKRLDPWRRLVAFSSRRRPIAQPRAAIPRMARSGQRGPRDLGSCAWFLGPRQQAGAGAVWPGDRHMTKARKLKQAIRTRAAKTGESYTAARVHVLKA